MIWISSTFNLFLSFLGVLWLFKVIFLSRIKEILSQENLQDISQEIVAKKNFDYWTEERHLCIQKKINLKDQIKLWEESFEFDLLILEKKNQKEMEIYKEQTRKHLEMHRNQDVCERHLLWSHKAVEQVINLWKDL